MTRTRAAVFSGGLACRFAGIAACLAVLPPAAHSQPEEAPAPFGDFFYTQAVELVGADSPGEGAYSVPLGAMKKLKGSWRPEESERLRGVKHRYTYRMEEGYGSGDVVAELETFLQDSGNARLLYSCDARACGNGSQWASRVFEERLLYGRAETQRYRAWQLERDGEDYRALVYASARSADRQYLRLEILIPQER